MMTGKRSNDNYQEKYGDYKYPKLQETFEHFFHRGEQEYHDALLDVQLCREFTFICNDQGVEPVCASEKYQKTYF
jgi:hypothetical protein